MTDGVRTFLQNVLSVDPNEGKSDIQVTLTFAQSVNAKIAGQGGQQLLLSCKESMIMTHWYLIFEHSVVSADVNKE